MPFNVLLAAIRSSPRSSTPRKVYRRYLINRYFGSEFVWSRSDCEDDSVSNEHLYSVH